MVKRKQTRKVVGKPAAESPPNDPLPSETTPKKKTKGGITLAQIKSDKLTLLAEQYWSPHTAKNHLPYNAEIIVDIYNNEINRRDAMRNIIMLEFSQYLERYLWPNYDPANSSHEHVMSICCDVQREIW